jgi:hypothetical protein
MKKVIAISLFTFLLGNVSIAQEKSNQEKIEQHRNKNKSPEERAKINAAKAEQQLGLTAEQKQKWENAALIKIKANQPMREKLEGSTTPEERKAIRIEMQKNEDVFEKEVTGFLTGEQLAKYKIMKSEKKGKKHGHEKAVEAPSISPSLIDK